MSNRRKVQVVTDSTSDIPAHLREELQIDVVPLSINFENETLLDGVDLTPQEYVQRLRSVDKLPSTAQPTVEQFLASYRKSLDADMDVICITISTGLSGTYNSASLAAEQLDPERIRVVDSLSGATALGWLVVETARAVQGGATLQEAVAVAEQNKSKVHFMALLQTLDYVYKGGRIGKANHMVGSALGIKPILGLENGVVVPLERVRTWKKALKRLVELAASRGNLLDVAVVHTDNPDDAQQVLQELTSRFPGANFEVVFTGTTVSTYAGPGAVGIMFRVE